MMVTSGVRADAGGANKAIKGGRLDKAARERFFEHLSVTCNVVAAAAAAGVTPGAVYLRRSNDAGFADAWGVALALGYEMLETRLVGHALAGEEGPTLADGSSAMGPTSIELALKLLTAHRNATGKPKRVGARPQFARPEETDKAILAKLDQIEKRRAKLAAEDAADAAARGATSEAS